MRIFFCLVLSYVPCYAVFGSYPWEACSFLKGNRRGVDLGVRGGGGGGDRLRGVGGGDVLN